MVIQAALEDINLMHHDKYKIATVRVRFVHGKKLGKSKKRYPALELGTPQGTIRILGRHPITGVCYESHEIL